MDKSRLKTYGIWAGGVLLLLLLAGLIYTTMELSDAKRKTIEAQIDREKAIASEEQNRKNSQAVIRQIEEEKAELKRIAEQANRNTQLALSTASKLSRTRDSDIAGVPKLTDTQLTIRISELARDAYPTDSGNIKWDGDGFYADRRFIESASKSFIETVSLRQENEQLRTAVDEQSKQVAALLEIVDADKAARVALESRIQGLEDVMRTDTALVKALQSELQAEKRKNFWRKLWGGVAVGGAVVAGVLVGKSL